jgi:hypothetical protein
MKVKGRRIRVGRLVKKEIQFCEIWGMKRRDFSDVAEGILQIFTDVSKVPLYPECLAER